MGGDQSHPQFAGGEHHYYLVHPGLFGEKLGMAGKGRIGTVADHVLCHRGGDHGSEGAIQTALCRAAEHGERAAGGGRIGLAGSHRRPDRSVPDRQGAWRQRLPWLPVGKRCIKAQLRGPLGQHLTVADGNKRGVREGGRQCQDQIRTDTCGIPAGDGNRAGRHGLVPAMVQRVQSAGGIPCCLLRVAGKRFHNRIST